MSNSGMSADYRGGGDQRSTGDGRDELKAMLDTIAAQLQDADRRHTTALNEMQHRISGMTREADVLRPRVPDQFAPAFAQIEAGIGALAHRLADVGQDEYRGGAGSAQRRNRAATRPDASVSGEAFDPWDRQSADALAGFYGNVASRRDDAEDDHASSNIDEAWLESRFAEIARGIEHSLAHVKPGNELADLNQRIDQFERQFAKVFSGVATHDDLAAVRQIEANMVEVVHHLEKTNDQLDRLSTLEMQLANVSETLAQMQAASATRASPDIDAIARAVAEETAQRFAERYADDRNAGADELRPLLEQLMAENRQGGEQTAAILDTMQQAMVRLLDRVDAIDLSPPAPFSDLEISSGYGEPQRSASDASGVEPFEPLAPPFPDFEMAGAAPIEQGMPPLPSFSGPYGDAMVEDMALRSEKMRQEFVADVRRAKARLAQEGDQLTAGPPAAPLSNRKPVRPAPAAVKNSFGPSAPSPRLMLIAALVIVALAGLWYTFGFGVKREPQLLAPAPTISGSSAQDGKSTGGGSSDAVKTPQSVPGGDGEKTIAPTPDANGPRGDIAPTGPLNHADSASAQDSAPEPRTALPMIGVAVDLDQPVSQAELEQARRHQAMAAMSGELGNAAGRPEETGSIPKSIVPSEAETEGVAPQPQANGDSSFGASRTASPEMPSAMIGPLSLRLAAANGDSSAQFEVGARYAEGKGVTQNFKEAAKWYQRSADQGFAQAQYRLATLYERGLGLKPDRAQAAVFYERAAAQGNIKAMHNLAVLSANQTDRAPDYAAAAHWFSEAAKRGLPDSQFNLAILYENGLGVDRDMKQAFLWVSLAARAGDADATRRRDILRGKLTAQEIADAQILIANWRMVPSDRAINDALVAGDLWKKGQKSGISG